MEVIERKHDCGLSWVTERKEEESCALLSHRKEEGEDFGNFWWAKLRKTQGALTKQGALLHKFPSSGVPTYIE